MVDKYTKDYNNPKKRLKEMSNTRIYSDNRIEEILQILRNIKIDIKDIKSQISAHDYNIEKVIKNDKQK